MKNKLSLKNINKTYSTKSGNVTAIEDITLDVKDGEILAIIGTSGCGKSTLLNIISGLDHASTGKIRFLNDNPRISYMLQSDALLSWRTVLDNACLGLELMHEKTEENVDNVKSLLCEYGLEDFIDSYPSNLSGGMKQRVALIRSLATNPDLILLDEPFSALDYYTRINISKEVVQMIRESKTTAIIITHDIAEALSLADRIVVLSKRPSHIKKIYEIDFDQNLSPIEKRSLKEFNEIYENLWRDLDDEI